MFATFRVFKLSIDGGKPIQLTGFTPSEDRDEDVWPTWSPDGSGSRVAKRVGAKNDVWLVDPERKRPYVQITTTGQLLQADVVPDGKEIWYTVSEKGNEDIWVASDITIPPPPAANVEAGDAQEGDRNDRAQEVREEAGRQGDDNEGEALAATSSSRSASRRHAGFSRDATASIFTPSSFAIESHAKPPRLNSTTFAGVVPGFRLVRAKPYAIATSPYPRPHAACWSRSVSGLTPNWPASRATTAASPSGVDASRFSRKTER